MAEGTVFDVATHINDYSYPGKTIASRTMGKRDKEHALTKQNGTFWFKHILFRKVYMGTNIMLWKYIMKDRNESDGINLVFLFNNNNCEKKAKIMYKLYSELMELYLS